MSTTPAEQHLAWLAAPIAEVVPHHAHIQDQHRFWSAIWTTPAGIWEVRLKTPQLEPDTAEITGPGLHLAIDDPPNSDLLIHTLNTIGAVNPRRATPSQDTK